MCSVSSVWNFAGFCISLTLSETSQIQNAAPSWHVPFNWRRIRRQKHRTKATSFAYHLPHTSKGQLAIAFLHLNPLIKASEPANYHSYMHVTLKDLLEYSCSPLHAALKHMRGSPELIQGLFKEAEINMTGNAKKATETLNCSDMR